MGTSATAEPHEWVPPREFDDYALIRPLGRGAMGQVYLAHDRLLDRPVAIKFMLRHLDARARARFEVEARAAARLQHPHVVTVHRVGVLQSRPYIVTEFVRGTSLSALSKPVSPRVALELALGLTRGLAAAHRRGVLHRDIKPANAILAEDGTVVLLDFGLAKLAPTPGPEESWRVDLAEVAREFGHLPTLESSTGSSPSDAGDDAPDERARGEVAATISATASIEPRRATGGEAGEGEDSDVVAGEGGEGGDEGEDGGDEGEDGGDEGEDGGEPTGDRKRDGGDPGRGWPDVDWNDDSLWMGAQRRDGAASPFDPEWSSGDDLTRPGHVVGTPYYMAPEVWAGEGATARSDVYSLGVVLYELCTGLTPHHSVPVDELPFIIEERAARPIGELARDLDPRLAAIIHRCIERDPRGRFGSGVELWDALDALVTSGRAGTMPEGNPYRGLLPFEAEHRALFFGRGSEIRTVVERMRTERLLIVAGESGVGKSSLCRAGVLPRVLDGALGDARRWSVVTLVPGRHPLSALVAATSGVLGIDADVLAREIAADPYASASRVRARLGDREGLVVFIDQLEELITLSDRDEADTASTWLYALADRFAGVRVLATARGDYLTRLAEIAELGGLIDRAFYLLRPLDEGGLRATIVGPAHATGVAFESDELIDELVAAAARAESALPLLQFTLAELWDARDPNTGQITKAALAALGGVEGALARHADRVIEEMPARVRAAARPLLVRLVTLQGTRARHTRDDLAGGDAARRDALEALVRGRLLVAREGYPDGARRGGRARAGDGDGGATTVYELAHEALLSAWRTLRTWIEAEEDNRAVMERVAIAASEWKRLGRTREMLWGPVQLAQVEGLDRGRLAVLDQAFLTASERALRRRKWLGWAAAAVLAALPVIAYMGLTELDEWREQRRIQHRVADYRAAADAIVADAQTARDDAQALRAAGHDAFIAREFDAGREFYRRAMIEGGEADKHYLAARQKLELALALAPTSAGTRQMLAAVLHEQALLAEHMDNRARVDDLLNRLELYDDDQALLARWRRPAAVAIGTRPDAATATVAQYADTPDGARPLGEPRALVTTPVDAALSAGSYVIELSRAGYAPVRYPVRLAPGERFELDVALLAEDRVPPGFVYLPAGRYLFGTDNFSQIDFWDTVPLHERTTGAYLIARDQTTFADWIRFLDALPAAERAVRTPNTDGVALSRGPDGRWRLALTPHARTYRAGWGEPIVYESRTENARQDWRRFPVTGIGVADVRAYLGWLDHTGRVPGARLCREDEWERAARGADARTYPHGDIVRPDDANIDVTYGRIAEAYGPDEVGAHPASTSPFGLRDMLGNAFDLVEPILPSEGKLVARGGAYYFRKSTGAIPNRYLIDASWRDRRLGFRVCAPARAP